MTDNVTNFLASGIEIKGTIRFQNDMHIDGKIEGEIISDKGKVTIGETAQIKGDITAGDVRIYGNVEGKVTSDRCELKQQARVVGDMKRRSLAIEEGNRLKNSRLCSSLACLPCTGRFSKSVKARRGFSGGGENEERKKGTALFSKYRSRSGSGIAGNPWVISRSSGSGRMPFYTNTIRQKNRFFLLSEPSPDITQAHRRLRFLLSLHALSPPPAKHPSPEQAELAPVRKSPAGQALQLP